MKCIICNRRPAINGSGYCGICTDKIATDNRRNRPPQPEKFLVYRGAVVGLFPNGTANGERLYRAELLRRKPTGLPKSKTINLDHWCEGYSREQIKKMKATVLRLANA